MSTGSKDTTTAEPRRATRKVMRTLGEIVQDGKDHGTGCTVLDMSASGARLKVDGAVRRAFTPTVVIPETFRLLIARDNISIDCRLAWRDNDMIGVSFTSTFRPMKAPAKRA